MDLGHEILEVEPMEDEKLGGSKIIIEVGIIEGNLTATTASEMSHSRILLRGSVGVGVIQRIDSHGLT